MKMTSRTVIYLTKAKMGKTSYGSGLPQDGAVGWTRVL